MRTQHRDDDRTDDRTDRRTNDRIDGRADGRIDGRADGRADDDAFIETSGDRRALAAHAGIGRISLTSVVAGMLVGFGAFGLIAGVATAIAQATSTDSIDLNAGDWRTYGVGAGIAAALIAFLAWFYGGYVAGRMARRSGAANGVLSAILGVVVIAVVGAIITGTADNAASQATSGLRSFGIPTDSDEWRSVGTIAGLGTLLMMMLGSLFGGVVGERWHTRLLTRALDPEVGTEAVARSAIARDNESMRDHRAQADEARDDAFSRVSRGRDVDHAPIDEADISPVNVAEQERRLATHRADDDDILPAKATRRTRS